MLSVSDRHKADKQKKKLLETSTHIHRKSDSIETQTHEQKKEEADKVRYTGQKETDSDRHTQKEAGGQRKRDNEITMNNRERQRYINSEKRKCTYTNAEAVLDGEMQRWIHRE